MVLDYGDRVLLLTELGNRYMVTLKRGEKLHAEDGVLSHDALVGKEHGDVIETSKGVKVAVLFPSAYELLASMPRRTQIVYPKDLGLIAFLADARPGCKIVEGGTGSGVLALYLATRVTPGGLLVSYDLSDERFPVIERIAERMGVKEVLRLKKGSLAGVEERGVDAFIADVPDPWTVIGGAVTSLKGGGAFVAIVPSVNQLERTVAAMRGSGIIDQFVGEVMIRPWRVKVGATRPVHVMRGHTVFIASGRKVNLQDVSNWNLKLPLGFR
ncbi:MAG: protein methyltransferase [Thaumarchaeota archaeon]|nr:protein methyltransferase [Candidatus Calditenuaceae archaeon]MDW8041659.1 protein methyltransferase [Nitrososphaerota archaeon]